MQEMENSAIEQPEKANPEMENGSSDVNNVFLCGYSDCREIFGDSLGIVRENVDLQSVSLQMVTDAVILTNVCETSVEGTDSGSTFQLLRCKSCQGGIGCLYKTTPRSLDCIRDLYTLDLNKVKSYHLGSCTRSKFEPLMKDPVEKLEETIVKTQSMLIALHERVEKLESCLQEEVDSDKETQRGYYKKRKTKYR